MVHKLCLLIHYSLYGTFIVPIHWHIGILQVLWKLVTDLILLAQ